MLASIPTVGALFAIAAAIVGLVLLAGLVAGQFRRGVVQELRESLLTATNEISIERGRSDRLEREAIGMHEEIKALRAQVATLHTVLRDDQQIARLVGAELKNELATLIQHDDEKLQENVALGVARGLEAPVRALTAAVERIK